MTWREILNILQKIPEQYLDDVAYVGDLSQNNNPNDRNSPSFNCTKILTIIVIFLMRLILIPKIGLKEI